VVQALGTTVKDTPGVLICFEGLDGAGKTSTSRAVCEALNRSGVPVTFIERKDPNCEIASLTQRLALLKEFIWQYGDAPLQEFGDHHALFNMASWMSAIDTCKIRPMLSAGAIIVTDNWYYKFLARMTIKRTIDPQFVRMCFAHLTKPDCVIHLDIDPASAAERKKIFAKGETGYFDGFGEPNTETFIRYQSAVREIMREYSSDKRWFTLNVDALNQEDVLRIVFDHIHLKLSPLAAQPCVEHSTL
jgi:dTMP kinase